MIAAKVRLVRNFFSCFSPETGTFDCSVFWNNVIRARGGVHLTFQVAYIRNIGTRHLRIDPTRTHTSTGEGKDGYVIRDCYVNIAARLRTGTQSALLRIFSVSFSFYLMHFRTTSRKIRDKGMCANWSAQKYIYLLKS